MRIYENFTQGTDQWFKIRQGIATASQFNRIITAKNMKPSASRWELMDELLAERYIPDDDFTASNHIFTGQKFIGNKYTDHGNTFEPESREHFQSHYCEARGLEVEQVGFIADDRREFGCSPDGLIRQGGSKKWIAGWETKCKCLKSHISFLRSGTLPDEHMQQIHGSMVVTGLDEWHFYSYFPGKNPGHLVVFRDSYTERMAEVMAEFADEFKDVLKIVVPLLDSPAMEIEEQAEIQEEEESII